MGLRIFSFYLLLCVILADSSPLWAQPYHSIFHNTSWSARAYIISPVNITYTLAGDSIENTTNYKILSPNFPVLKKALLKEDVNTGRVWYRNFADTEKRDILVMDMTLAIGDSFYLGRNGRGNIYVDSVYTWQGRKHIQFDLGYAQSKDGKSIKFTFIEGVGTSYVFSYKDSTIPGHVQDLFCAFKDNNKVYGTLFNTEYFNGDCYSTLSIEDLKTAPSKDIFVYVDLSRSVLRLTIPGNDKTYPYRVVNAVGQVLMQAKTAPNIQQDIDISSLPPGTYIFYLLRDNKKVAVTRFSR